MKILSNFSFPGDDAFEICCYNGVFHDRNFDTAPGMTWDMISNNLPENWEPDVLLFRWPLYKPIPSGIEKCPCPSIVLLDDWFTGVDYLPDNLTRFDYIFTDKAGISVLNKLGIKNVDYWPHFGYSPQVFYRNPRKRDIDISFTGSFNQFIQADRIPWIHRICKMDKKYNINIFHDLWRDDYREALNRSRIVFNRSLKGEMNKRAFEATACGALLFLEEENLEVRDFFEPDTEVILYNASNLEEKLTYYLEHENEREKIAEKACQKSQGYTYPKLFKSLIESIREKNLQPGTGRKAPSIFFNLPAHRDFCQYARSIKSVNNSSFDTINQLVSDFPDNPLVLNDCAALLATLQIIMQKQHKHKIILQAVKLIEHGLKNSPHCLLLQYNRAAFLNECGSLDEAAGVFSMILETEHPADWEQYNGFIYPFLFHFPQPCPWSLELLPVLTDKSDMAKIRHRLLRFFSAANLGYIYTLRKNQKESLSFFRQAQSIYPENTYLQSFIIKNNDIGVLTKKDFENAFRVNPLDTAVWLKLIQYKRIRNEDTVPFIKECRLVLSRFQDTQSAKKHLPLLCAGFSSLSQLAEKLSEWEEQ